MRSHSLSRLTFIPHPHSRSFDCRRHSCKDHHRTPPLRIVRRHLHAVSSRQSTDKGRGQKERAQRETTPHLHGQGGPRAGTLYAGRQHRQHEPSPHAPRHSEPNRRCTTCVAFAANVRLGISGAGRWEPAVRGAPGGLWRQAANVGGRAGRGPARALYGGRGGARRWCRQAAGGVDRPPLVRVARALCAGCPEQARGVCDGRVRGGAPEQSASGALFLCVLCRGFALPALPRV